MDAMKERWAVTRPTDDRPQARICLASNLDVMIAIGVEAYCRHVCDLHNAALDRQDRPEMRVTCTMEDTAKADRKRRRDEFAKYAMAGLLAYPGYEFSSDAAADQSVIYADATIAELDRTAGDK